MVSFLKTLTRKAIRGAVLVCDAVVPGGMVRVLGQINHEYLERALFHQAPIRQFAMSYQALRAHPPSASLVQCPDKQFYHLIPWLYRSNAMVDVFLCEHTISEGLFLYEMCRLKRDGILVEVGRRLGGSTLVMAAALGRGRLYSLDILPLDDQTLVRYLEELALARNVEILVARSTAFHPQQDERIDLLFLDGCKDTDEAVQSDVRHFVPYLKVGGFVLMHDYNEAPVQRAVAELTRQGFVLKDRVGEMVCLEKPA